MTDYSQLSDFEINHMIAKLIGLKLQSSESLLYNTKGEWEIFDPCCNPADAWPIIVESRINMTTHVDCWKAERNGFCFFNENPLRAAMIVFLMMKGAENAPAI